METEKLFPWIHDLIIEIDYLLGDNKNKKSV